MEKLMIFGDSYSTYEGYIPQGYACYYSGHRESPPDLDCVEKTWWKSLVNECGYELVLNNSWSGSTIGYTGYNNSDCSHSSSYIYRFETLLANGFFDANKIDKLIVFGGTNDSWSNAPLGEFKIGNIEEQELYCVLPAISRMAERLSVVLPDTKVYFIGNCDIKSEITDAMAEACAHYGHTYIALSGIDKVNGHPTALGMAQIKDQIKAVIA